MHNSVKLLLTWSHTLHRRAVYTKTGAHHCGSAGTSMQASQAGETVPLGPPDFLRLQYSTDPPSSAYNSRESTPDQAAEVTQPNHQAVQVSETV